jgi:DNA replication initiation complex subunit (GINS family)
MTLQETGVKFIVLATALLVPTLAFAQGAAPAPAPAAPAKQAAPKHAAPKHAAAPPQTSIETLEITQVIGIRQIDPATYEIGVRQPDGKEVHLRANAFVMQNLGQLLGTYGK